MIGIQRPKTNYIPFWLLGPLFRRVFRDYPELFAEQTGVPLSVIKNTWTMYQVGVSRLPMDPDAFTALADQTLNDYRSAIPWWPISVSWHRMEHWPEMSRLLPPTISLGHLSEVGTEINEKFIRTFLVYYGVKMLTFLNDQQIKVIHHCLIHLLKMALGETIRQSYECSPLLSLFVCVKNGSSRDRFL